MKTLRILTTVHLANPGACIFIEALTKALQTTLPDYDVRVLDYLPLKWYFYELARAFRPNSKQPFLNLQRYIKSEKFHHDSLLLDNSIFTMPNSYDGMVRFLSRQSYDALVVGMVVWDIVNKSFIPRFPNIYWLSDDIPAKKIAYAASGHRTDFNLFRQHLPEIRRSLNSFSLIGVRDNITYQMIQEAGLETHIPVIRVPDPAFLCDSDSPKIQELLEEAGVDLTKPIVGFMFYGNDVISKRLAKHFHAMDYQIVSLSMYNPYADINLAHLLSPHEWASIFPMMVFCITDRFHGTVMCLKSKTPFISIEPYKPLTPENSKIQSLLKDFDSLDLFMDEYAEDFSFDQFLEKIRFISQHWDKTYKPRIEKKLASVYATHHDFQQKIALLLGEGKE